MSDHRQNGQISKTTSALIGLVFILGMGVLYLVARQSGSPEADPVLIVEASDDNPVLAVVYNEPITRHQLEFAAAQWNKGLPEVDALSHEQALDRLIQQRLLVKMGRDLGVDQTAETSNRVNFTRDQILAEDGAKAFLDDAVTEADINEYYESERRIRAEQIQIRARQIVTPDEATAREIVRRLDKGEAFATLALAFSLDRASRESGGDLGFLNYDMLEPVISDKIFAAQDGDRLQPFASPQGWHVVEVMSRRKAPVPSLEERRDAIISLLKARKLETRLGELHRNANIQILKD